MLLRRRARSLATTRPKISRVNIFLKRQGIDAIDRRERLPLLEFVPPVPEMHWLRLAGVCHGAFAVAAREGFKNKSAI